MTRTDAIRPGEYAIPPSAIETKCKSCGAAIVYAKTKAGKPIPLSLATARSDPAGRRWALSHFADCPHAAQHRNRNSAAARGMSLAEFMADVASRGGTIRITEWENGQLPVCQEVRADE